MTRFQNKTVLVTGGSTGIGLATAQAFAQEGARVHITGRDQGSLDQALGAIGQGSLAWQLDTADLAGNKALAAKLAADGTTLDAVFINAGIARMVPFADVDEATWDQLFNTNVKGAYFLIQALLPVLKPGAAIVLNGSINAHLGMPNTTVYAASKAALISLAKTLSAELLPRGVRVNVVSPGPVQTPLYGKLGLDATTLQATAAAIEAQVPLGRFGTPAEIAATVLHLSAPESAFIVGTEIIADGGMAQL